MKIQKKILQILQKGLTKPSRCCNINKVFFKPIYFDLSIWRNTQVVEGARLESG